MAVSLSQVANLGYMLGNSMFGLFNNGSSNYMSNAKELAAFNALLNYSYSQKSLKNSPSATREGLEKANYNPMLALGNIGQSGASGWTGSTGAGSYDYNSPVKNVLEAGQLGANVRSQTAQADNLESQTTLNNIDAWWKPLHEDQIFAQREGEIALKTAQTAGQIEQNKWIGHKAKAEIDNLVSQSVSNFANANAVAKQTEANVRLIDSQIGKIANDIGISKDLLANTINKTTAEIELMGKQGILTEQQVKNLKNLQTNRNYQAFLQTLNTGANLYGVATGNPSPVGYQSTSVGF